MSRGGFRGFSVLFQLGVPQVGETAGEASHLAHLQTGDHQAGQRAVPGTGENGVRSASGSAETPPRGRSPAENTPALQTLTSAVPGRACRGQSRTPSASFVSRPGEEFRFSPEPPCDTSEWSGWARPLWARRSGRTRRSPNATRVPCPHCQAPVCASLLGEGHGLGANEEHKAGSAPRGDRTDAHLRPAPAARRARGGWWRGDARPAAVWDTFEILYLPLQRGARALLCRPHCPWTTCPSVCSFRRCGRRHSKGFGDAGLLTFDLRLGTPGRSPGRVLWVPCGREAGVPDGPRRLRTGQ